MEQAPGSSASRPRTLSGRRQPPSYLSRSTSTNVSSTCKQLAIAVPKLPYYRFSIFKLMEFNVLNLKSISASTL